MTAPRGAKIYLADKGRAPTEAELFVELERLSNLLANFDKDYKKAEMAPSNVIESQRMAIYDSLEVVLGFLNALSMRSRSLDRLLLALDALIVGPTTESLFITAKKSKGKGGANPDPPVVQALRGTLAGISASLARYDDGYGVEEADRWVAENVSEEFRRRLKITHRAVRKWRELFGGKYARPDIGRENYERILEKCERLQSASRSKLGDDLLRDSVSDMLSDILSETEQLAVDILPLPQKTT